MLIPMKQRNYTLIDQVIVSVDVGLRTLFGRPASTGRANPADAINSNNDTSNSEQETSTELSESEKKHSAALMRVNHCGEVCAQALYQGQALTARDAKVRDTMQTASNEENDHLNWCKQRITDLDSHTSYLNPLWYSGSFAIGVLAGALGDKWSLGFLEETEKQVVDHLQTHLKKLPEKDKKSRAIIEQMKIDEAKHASLANESGAADLPKLIKKIMSLGSKTMTKTSYWL